MQLKSHRKTVDMMEYRLRKAVDQAEDPFRRHMAALMLEYYLSGYCDFWMEGGEITWQLVELEDSGS